MILEKLKCTFEMGYPVYAISKKSDRFRFWETYISRPHAMEKISINGKIELCAVWSHSW